MSEIKYKNYEKWQSINDLNCNDVNISYADKVRLYQYYDSVLHFFCMIKLSHYPSSHFDKSNKIDIYNGDIIKNTFLTITKLFLRNEFPDTTKIFFKYIITFLKNEKYIRNIKLKNIFSENSIDYTDEFIIWYKDFLEN